MRFHGESVLDASLAFLDEIDELPDLPDMANHLEAALIDPTEMMLNELLGLANADEGNARIPDPSATTIVMSVKEETGKPIKTRKKGSKPIGMGTKAARKQEIEFLRTQVQELEGELSRLQKGLVPSTEPTLWERIAKRQRDVRKQHEAENTELRVLYQGQLKVARGLVRLLHRGQADMSSAWGNVKRRRIIEADEHSGQIFQSIRSLVARLVPVDKWMEESGFARIYDTFDDARVCCGPENDIFLEILLCRRFPFPFEATVEAVWNHLCAATIELETAVYGAVERSDMH
ncbi:hypothetical protein Poli38472_004835 [Pythium oligandrum]|uniref:Uncharacterized protein n=1 Tax=Pythium oligandrum TaxID=41045 RepID=A0A8K1CAK4_PYTOL|nr:hypothetical protein Poli38472_004835 [Pythium oligandrum]|eukprot:TMW59766.1 hypothetical protein Poli38472_004835 [Pythium oligandrum]